jgi:hypothetical protein
MDSLRAACTVCSPQYCERLTAKGNERMATKTIDQMMRKAGEDSAKTTAIMILLDREAQRDPDFPESATRLVENSLATIPVAEGETENYQKQVFVYARAHFQTLLGRALKTAEQKKASAPREAPKPKSFLRRLLGK